MMYEVTAWDVVTNKFSGLVYTQAIALDKLAEGAHGTIKMVKLYRKHEPMPHMTYREVPND